MSFLASFDEMKDERFNTVKILIETGHVTEFTQIFKHIAKTAVAGYMGIHLNRFNKILADPGFLTVREIYILASFIEIPAIVLFGLIDKQHGNAKPVKKKRL